LGQTAGFELQPRIPVPQSSAAIPPSAGGSTTDVPPVLGFPPAPARRLPPVPVTPPEFDIPPVPPAPASGRELFLLLSPAGSPELQAANKPRVSHASRDVVGEEFFMHREQCKPRAWPGKGFHIRLPGEFLADSLTVASAVRSGRRPVTTESGQQCRGSVRSRIQGG
jgi:hypothetical protein